MGEALYAGYCAGCHGKHLQGQALWQIDDGPGRRRAPALDQAGHAWWLSDEALLQRVRQGNGAMPAYRNTLDDDAIRSVLAFMKSTWPVGLQVAQSLLSPGQPKMANRLEATDWRFPGRCRPGH